MRGCWILEILGTSETSGQTYILLQVARPNSKHCVVVRRGLRDGLDYVPVLDDLTVFKPKDVYHSFATLPRRTHPVAVHDDEISVGKNALQVHMGARIIIANPKDEFAHPIESVFDHWIVLAIILASVLCNCLSGIEFIESLFVKGERDLLVLF